MSVSDTYETRNRPLGTWVSEAEATMFAAICAHHNIKPAVMLRALVVDCIAEEGHKVAASVITRRKTIPADLFAIAQA